MIRKNTNYVKSQGTKLSGDKDRKDHRNQDCVAAFSYIFRLYWFLVDVLPSVKAQFGFTAIHRKSAHSNFLRGRRMGDLGPLTP